MEPKKLTVAATSLQFHVLLLLFLSFTSCNIQRQVWLSGVQKLNSTKNDAVVRVYIDKWGDLYPEKQYVTEEAFFDPKNNGSALKEVPKNGNLRDYFASHPTEFDQLASNYNVSSGSRDTATFNKIQTQIISRYTDSLNKQLKKSKSKTLVVLVHGFNVEDGTCDFDYMRNAINNYKSNDFVYCEVYWDGLTAGGALPFLKAMWGRSQQNSGYVAITLRRILAAVEDNTQIRILAHSMGSGVATGALFDAYHKFSSPPADMVQEYKQFAPNARNNIRLGLVAPAIPGKNTFAYFLERGGTPITQDQNNISKIVLGINTKDYALTKGIGLSKQMGSTSLGGYKTEYAETKQIFVDTLHYTREEADMLFQKIPFEYNKKNPTGHGIKDYFSQEEAKNKFLKALFD